MTKQDCYYLTPIERAIFEVNADEIVSVAASGARLNIVELGAGTATKTCLLLEAVVRAQGSVTYQPVDVSATALDEAKRLLVESLNCVSVKPLIADYNLESIIHCNDATDNGRDLCLTQNLVLFIGSSIGAYSQKEAVLVLKNIRQQLQSGDTLLLSTDMVKDEKSLVLAYNDGIHARFHLNALHRLNYELGSKFELENFEHKVVWNKLESRIEAYLVSKIEQTVSLGVIKCEITFKVGESIHMMNSHKYTQQSIRWLLTQSGFQLKRQWVDAKEWYAVNLAVAT
jgi:dimethylhistidine N-methyltransferase